MINKRIENEGTSDKKDFHLYNFSTKNKKFAQRSLQT